MKEIFVMLAKAMTKKQCIDRLAEAVSEYKEAELLGKNLDEVEHNLLLSCHLFLLNGIKGDATDVIKDMEMVDKSVNFFKTTTN